MNVIFLLSEPYPQGMAGTKRVKLFAEYLANIDNQIRVIVNSRDNGKNSIVGCHKNVNFRLIKTSGLYWIINIFKIFISLKNNFNHYSKNILFVYDSIGITDLLYVFFAKFIGYKIVTDVVEDRTTHHENIRLRRKIHLKINNYIEKYLLSLIDGIVVISKSLENKYKDKSKKQVKLIQISAENLLMNIDIVRKQKLFRFTYSGSFSNKDGLIYLLEAFRMLKSQYKNIELALSGTMIKKSSNKYNKFLSKKGIHYYGFIPDEEFFNFLTNSDALIMPRLNTKHAHSGFPFKLGEYLATGKPVIATRVSDINLYLTNKNNAILIEPSNKQSLYEAMEYVLNNKSVCDKIGENGKKLAMKYFNPQINGNLLMEFLKQI